MKSNQSNTFRRTSKILPFQKTNKKKELSSPQEIYSFSQKPLIFEEKLGKNELLKHLVQEGSQVLQNLDNLGNFMMGFGVLVLGYLLNVNLKVHFQYLLEPHSFEIFSLSFFALLSWSLSIVLLLGFVYLFIFHLLAGRSIYATKNNPNSIGERISIKGMGYRDFEKMAPTFEDFLKNNFLSQDQKDDEQIWYATFRYSRYMAYRKLMVMNKMREMLGIAILSGVFFKLLDILIQTF